MFKKLLSSLLIYMVLPVSVFAAFNMRAVNDNQIRWKDINVGANILSGPPGLLPEVENFIDLDGTDTGIATIGIAVGEATGGIFEIQHDYKEGTDLYFHAHWQGVEPIAGATDNLNWELTYTISRNGDRLAKTTVVEEETEIDLQYAFNVSDFKSIKGTDIKIGDQFLFTLQRIAASTDEYAGNAVMATLGIHYQVDDRGSYQIFIK